MDKETSPVSDFGGWILYDDEDICFHNWMVYSTAIDTCVLLVQCENCRATGIVPNPTKEEWTRAFYAPSAPYHWEQSERVISPPPTQ